MSAEEELEVKQEVIHLLEQQMANSIEAFQTSIHDKTAENQELRIRANQLQSALDSCQLGTKERMKEIVERMKNISLDDDVGDDANELLDEIERRIKRQNEESTEYEVECSRLQHDLDIETKSVHRLQRQITDLTEKNRGLKWKANKSNEFRQSVAEEITNLQKEMHGQDAPEIESKNREDRSKEAMTKTEDKFSEKERKHERMLLVKEQTLREMELEIVETQKGIGKQAVFIKDLKWQQHGFLAQIEALKEENANHKDKTAECDALNERIKNLSQKDEETKRVFEGRMLEKDKVIQLLQQEMIVKIAESAQKASKWEMLITANNQFKNDTLRLLNEYKALKRQSQTQEGLAERVQSLTEELQKERHSKHQLEHRLDESAEQHRTEIEKLKDAQIANHLNAPSPSLEDDSSFDLETDLLPHQIMKMLETKMSEKDPESEEPILHEFDE